MLQLFRFLLIQLSQFNLFQPKRFVKEEILVHYLQRLQVELVHQPISGIPLMEPITQQLQRTEPLLPTRHQHLVTLELITMLFLLHKV